MGWFPQRKEVKLADIFTLANGIAGFLSILFLLEGSIDVAVALIIFASILDYFDGKVAKLTKRSSVFGKELDSLADIVSFGVAPAVLVFVVYPGIFSLMGGWLLVSAGMLRLAHHNIKTPGSGFRGMPITVNGILFPVLVYLLVPGWTLPWALVLSSVLMVGGFRFPRILK